MTDEIIGVIQTLYYHRELISDCYVSTHGEIPDTIENSTAIRALKKNRLVWQMGGSEAITLTRPLLNLLAGAQQNRRRRLASDNINALWEHIQNRVSDYNDVISRASTEDLDLIKADIKDGLFELANDINTSIVAFSDYIDHGYAYTKDLLLRVKENERAIQKAKQLNDALQHLDIHSLVNGSRLNQEMKQLFLHNFLNAINESRAEFVNTLHRLNELLVKLRSDNALGKLIRTFETKFKTESHFTPKVPPFFESIPDAINFANPLIKPRRDKYSDAQLGVLPGDIYSPEHENELAALVKGLRKNNLQPSKFATHESQPITDNRGDVAEMEPEHPVISKARNLTLALASSRKEHSLVDVMKKLNIECPTSLWLSTVINSIYALPINARRHYELTFIESPSPLYSGNHLVHDIKVRYVK